MNKRRMAALLLVASAGAGAQAQSTRMMMPEGTYDLYFGLALGTTLQSESEGGNRSVVVPALSVQWSNGAFVEAGSREVVAGMHLSENPVFDYGVMASLSQRDQRSDTPVQRGGMAVQGGAFVHWQAAYNISLGADLQAGGGFDRSGLLAHPRIGYATPLAAHHSANFETGMFIADQRWMQGYFGVTQAQSASGGKRVYRASAGVLSVYGDVDWRWQVGNKYFLVTGVRLSRLVGPAADSPLVGRLTRISLGSSLTYHF